MFRDRGRIIGVGLATALVAGLLALPATAGAVTATPGTSLGPGLFGTMVVDAARSHVFVSTPETNSVEELSYTGTLLNSVTVTYPQGMVINGNYLYVVEGGASPGGTIAKIDLTAATLAPVALNTTPLNIPQWIAFAGGKLWVTESGTSCCFGHIAAVDPNTGLVTEFPNDQAVNSIYDPDLATSAGAPNTLFVSEDGQSPGQVFRLDVSSGTPTLAATLATNASQWGMISNIRDMAVTADGSRVLPAAGATQNASGYTLYQVDDFAAANLLSDGAAYPTGPYPSAVATSPSGLVATGVLSNTATNDINVFRPDQATPAFSATVQDSGAGADIVPHGLAFSPDGAYLFAVGIDDVAPNRNTIFYSFPLKPITFMPPTLACSPGPSGWQDANVRINCGAQDVSGTGLANPADASFQLATTVAAATFGTNAYTSMHWVCDNAGNCSFAGPAGPFMVDLTAPSVTCGTPPSGWQTTNISVNCTATDTGSGLANPADAGFTLSTNVGSGGTDGKAFTSFHQVCDVAGNCTTAGPVGPVEVDMTAPTITIATPASGASYKQRSTVTVGFSCTDAGSGVASCTGTLANGSKLNTQQTGTFSFTVTATDQAGNKTSKTVSYTITKH